MPRYKHDVNRYVSEQVNIIDLIGSSVNLKRSGRNYVGLCPFHNEKTPSFSVSADKQIFKCFGCGESGDAISFAMKDRGLSFIEAIEWLSDRYHIDLSEYIEFSGESEKKYDVKLLYDIMTESARFYFKKLFESKNAQKYLIARDLKKEILYEFGIGYAPDAWSSLYEHLKKKGFLEKDMILCGLIKPNKKGGYYDSFRNRIMFPIFDIRGRVCAFGGRVLDDSLPKYLNSQETPIFNKSKTLYGLNFVNKNYKGESLIIVEGYMDLVALNQHGIKNVVATLGTALNIEHVKLMKRSFSDIIFAFDGDKAGRSAIYRSLPEFEKSGLRVRVLELLDSKDPDEFIKKRGREAFLNQVDAAISEIDFKIKFIKADFNLENSFDRLEFLNRIYSLVNELESESEKEIYLERLSKLVRLDFDAVKRDYQNAIANLGQKEKNQKNASSTQKKDFNQMNSQGISSDFADVSPFSDFEDLEHFHDLEHLEGLGESDFEQNLDLANEHMNAFYEEMREDDFIVLEDGKSNLQNPEYVKIKNIKSMQAYFMQMQSQNPHMMPSSNLDRVEKLLIRNAIASMANFEQIYQSGLKFIIYENILAFTLLEFYYERFDELRLANLISLFDIEDVELLKRISMIEIPISENIIASLIARHEFCQLEIELYNLDLEIRQLQLELDVESAVKLRLKFAQKVELSKKLLELRKNLNDTNR